MVSDCCAEGWYDPHVWQLLRSWAVSSPTTLINPLSMRLWRHTGSDLPAVGVTPTAIGTPNSRLAYRMPLLLQAAGDGNGDWLPLPAVTFTPHSLGRWAKTLMRNDPAGCNALLLPPSGRTAEVFEDEADDENEIMPADALVDTFQRIVSPTAARLAVLCAPYAQVSVPLLNLIRQELVPDATIGDVAELIVGGLLVAVPNPAGPPALHFREGMQAALQQLLTEDDAWRVYEALSRHVTDHAGQPTDFAAAVYDPEGNVHIPAGMQPFAEASRDVLRLLGALPDAGNPQMRAGSRRRG